jgi:hypothetical protein
MKWLGHRDSKMVRHHLHDAKAQRQMQRVRFIPDVGDTGFAGLMTASEVAGVAAG